MNLPQLDFWDLRKLLLMERRMSLTGKLKLLIIIIFFLKLHFCQLIFSKLTSPNPSKSSSEDDLKPSVIRTVFQIFKFEIIISGLLKATADLIQFANPWLLQKLLDFVSKPNGPLWQGLGYAFMMFGVAATRSLIIHTMFYMMWRVGLKAQTALIGAVYRKVSFFVLDSLRL